MSELFTPRGTPSRLESLGVQIAGLVLLVFIWSLFTVGGFIAPQILPSPVGVFFAFPELHVQHALLRNVLYSLFLNFSGYAIAITFSMVIGVAMGAVPFVRFLLKPYIDAARYLPINALTGLFILYFGIFSTMKIMFLAVGIIVYLLPLVVDRIDQVHEQLVDTAKSLRASKVQIVFKVLVPAAFSNIFGDIRVIVAVSWTYITIAEMLNRGSEFDPNVGGIGALMWLAQRNSRPDWMFALLFTVVLIGYLQDRSFLYLDRVFFPHKYSRETSA